MKYQLTHQGFPVGPWLIPNGVVIDTDTVPVGGWSKVIADRGIIPPIAAQALDAATYDFMCRQYGADKVGVFPIPTAAP
jgi:hypothetical protein